MKRISKTEIKEMRSQSKKNSIMFAFTLPTVILYTIFFLVTMLIGVYYSFTDWNGISKDYTFVGLKNYVKVLTDERFREALWFNIGYDIFIPERCTRVVCHTAILDSKARSVGKLCVYV